MNEIEVSWDDYKGEIAKHIKSDLGPRIVRGQANSEWKLVTSFHRVNKNKINWDGYFKIILPSLADQISTIENREIDIKHPERLASFLAFLQHHGWPTPLLDWTLSPYIAAYFAFSDINCEEPEWDYVGIYVFDYHSWKIDWEQVYSYEEKTNHVSILQPKSFGNLRQIRQQGIYYTFTNCEDIESHIIDCETKLQKQYLTKYIISVKQRPYIMKELELMGINSYSLFGTTESMIKYYRDYLFQNGLVGPTKSEKIKQFLEKFNNG